MSDSSAVNRTPWTDSCIVPNKVWQSQLNTSLFRLTLYRDPVMVELSISGWDGERLETKKLPFNTPVDAAKAEAIRMALRHLANAMISL